jgi:hypothetical protein
MSTPQQKGREYERKRAKKGMRCTPGSGSGWADKEDGNQGRFKLQLKTTEASSFRLRCEDYDELERNANSEGLDPAMLIRIRREDGHYRELLVIDESWLDFLCKVK